MLFNRRRKGLQGHHDRVSYPNVGVSLHVWFSCGCWCILSVSCRERKVHKQYLQQEIPSCTATFSHSECCLLGQLLKNNEQCNRADCKVFGHLTRRKVKRVLFSKNHWWKWSSWHYSADSNSVCERSASVSSAKAKTHGSISVGDKHFFLIIKSLPTLLKQLPLR